VLTLGHHGRPKGVLYSHRALVCTRWPRVPQLPGAHRERHCVCQSCPCFTSMLGLAFSCTFFDCDQILPGPHLDARSVAGCLESETGHPHRRVPTVAGALAGARSATRTLRSSRLRSVVVGAARFPPSVISRFQERHNLTVLHAWGMTEITPSALSAPARIARTGPSGGTVSLPRQAGHAAARLSRFAARRWRPDPLGRHDARRTRMRGPVGRRSAIYHADETTDRFCDERMVQTGDIVRIDPSGCIDSPTARKDLVQIWWRIDQSVALERADGHPAAPRRCIAVPHAGWASAPLAVAC